MSDRSGAVRRYLGSRKNIIGMVGALVGVGAHVVGLIGDVWPAVAIGLYGIGALVGPSDAQPAPERLTDALRADAAALRADTAARANVLPTGIVDAVTMILEVLRLVLDRLDQVTDQPADRAAAPERLAVVAEIIRVDLPMCLDTYAGRSPSSSQEQAASELFAQLDVIAGSADRLAAAVPDVHAQRAADLTRELRRRHEQ